jgi:predicted metal-dependent HD superfamily phosphohydrolase
VPALRTRWTLDIADLAPGAPPDTVAAIGADLLGRLAEPHRAYHTAHHLEELIQALVEIEEAHEVTEREATLARIAGWFHDAVYDPAATGGTNEAESAALAVRDLSALGLARRDVDAVRDLALGSELHELPSDRLSAAFHDADLWILSAPAERYAEYTAQVRREYAAVPTDAFRQGRAGILRPLLDREFIFATGVARSRWEDRARHNLTRELDELTAR